MSAADSPAGRPPASNGARGSVRFILLSFLLWRGALFALNFAVATAIPERIPNPERDYAAFPEQPFWDSFVRWDSGWYARIAQRGYFLEGAQSDVAFFPAYPYLARWLGSVAGGPYAAGLAISNLALLGALFFIHRIARRYLDEDGARRAVLYALVFPPSWFSSTFYAEGLFLFTVAGALYFYEEDRLLAAGLCGAAAALTRSTGIVLFPALLLGALHRRGWRLSSLAPRLPSLLLIPLGLSALALIQLDQVGDPWAWLAGQAAWGRESAFPLLALFREARSLNPAFPKDPYSVSVFLALDLAAALGLFAVAAASLRRLDSAHTWLTLGTVLAALSSGRVLSALRFSACVVPVYLVLASATRRPWLDRFLTYAFSLGLALEAVLFGRWYWAG